MANPTISQIAINGTTYDACDSQARADIKTLQDSVINSNGDIHTKYLYTANSININAGNMNLGNSGIDRDGANPSSTQYGYAYRILDKDNELISQIYTGKSTNGSIYLQLQAINEKTDGTELNNYISLAKNKDGSNIYSVADPAAFRSAIHAASENVVERAGASWIASSSNANGVQLTNKITSFVQNISYLVIAKYPVVTSNNFIVSLQSSGLMHLIGDPTGCSIIGTNISGIAGIWLVKATSDNANMYLVSSASASATFSNLSRGYLMSIRLS